jgi:hypothetical protein
MKKSFSLRSLALALSAVLFCNIAFAQNEEAIANYDANAATPRFPDGTPILGPDADGLGYWDRGTGPMVGGANYPAADAIPFKPWARALYDTAKPRLRRTIRTCVVYRPVRHVSLPCPSACRSCRRRT